MKPDPESSLAEKIVKYTGMILGAIVFILLSPVVVITLIIAFLIAF